MKWHLLTGEYPPQPGGVSTYTRQVACGLADAGDEVVVWAPPVEEPDRVDRSVTVKRLPDTFGARSLRTLDAALNAEQSPARVLVQYVPHAFGWKGANVPFCRWLASRTRDTRWVMFHEVAFPFDPRQSPLRNALAAANRVMARTLVRSASRVFVSIPGWRAMLEPLASGPCAPAWLPVPSGISVAGDLAAVQSVRAHVGAGHPIVGHFGTHSNAIRELLLRVVLPIAASTDCRLLLIGPGSPQVRNELLARDATLDGRVFSTGALSETEVSSHLQACDLLLQPYPDGLSTRRTSAMAALAHGVALASTRGWLTEPEWRDWDAAALSDVDAADALTAAVQSLLASAEARGRLARAGRDLYHARFDLRHTIAALRDPVRQEACA